MRKYKQIQIDVDVSRAIENRRLSFSETENDILRRIVLESPAKLLKSQLPNLPAFTARSGHRSRGQWEVVYNGQRSPAPNLKEAYRALLIKVSNDQTDFLTKFSKERGRSRLFVAKEATSLYENSPQLAKDYAQKLVGDWYFDTNLSREQVAQRARIAAKVANMIYGSGFNISEGGVAI